MSVDKPHDPRLGVARDPADKPGAVALVARLLLRLRDEARLEPFALLIQEVGRPLPAGLHFANPLN